MMSHLFSTKSIRNSHKKYVTDYKRARKIVEKSLGINHEEVANILNNIGLVLKKQAKYEEAKEFYAKSLSIIKSVFGAKHPKVGTGLYNLADIYR